MYDQDNIVAINYGVTGESREEANFSSRESNE